MSYSSSAREGRDAAWVTNTTRRMVTIVEHRRRQQQALKWVPPAPPFTTVAKYVEDPAHAELRIDAVADCGHVLHTARFETSAALLYTYKVGARKRCPECPPPEPKPAPPDAERCTGEDGGEEAGWRRCCTRARWRVEHVTPGVDTRTELDRYCERHRRQAELIGSYQLDPRPHPHGYTDGGWDVVTAIPRPKKEPARG